MLFCGVISCHPEHPNNIPILIICMITESFLEKLNFSVFFPYEQYCFSYSITQFCKYLQICFNFVLFGNKNQLQLIIILRLMLAILRITLFCIYKKLLAIQIPCKSEKLFHSAHSLCFFNCFALVLFSCHTLNSDCIKVPGITQSICNQICGESIIFE